MTDHGPVEPSDRAVIERLGAKKVMAILDELGAVESVWGEDANGSLFFGWVVREVR